MMQFLRSLANAVIVVFFTTTFCFFLLSLLPGSAFEGERALAPFTQDAVKFKFGLQDSVLQNYLVYMRSLLRGSLGFSFASQGSSEVTEILRPGFYVSALLGALTLGISFCSALGLGLWHELGGKFSKKFIKAFQLLGISSPTYFFAGIFILIFAEKLRWFPVALFETKKSFVLPVIALSIRPTCILSRLWISTLRENQNMDYIRTARAKGLTELQILMRHMLRPTLLPVLNILGSLGPGILAGSFVIETMFALPGMGRGFVMALLQRDYPVVMGSILVYGFLTMGLRLLTDFLEYRLDPRLSRA